jgi:hypothetical protein
MIPCFKSRISCVVSLFLGVVFAAVSLEAEPRPLEVEGKPFEIRGITYGIQFDRERLASDFVKIKELGANSIRTWGCGPDTAEILDAARKANIKVMLGLWMRHGRAGAEGIDNFNYVTDEAGKQKQLNDTLAWVKKFKGHPALLCWGVGNEVGLNIATEPEKVAYAKFLEEVIVKIKEEDPVHAVASVSAWTLDVPLWMQYTPSIDLYGINVYGYGAAAIPAELKKLGAKRHYVVTEFGPRGEWDAPSDSNGGKIEPSDKEKYETIAKGWKDMIEKNRPECLGAYVFNFGNGFDHTSLWLSLNVDGARRPVYWATLKAFTGKEADNEAPEIGTFMIKGADQDKKPGEWAVAMVKYTDKESEECQVSFAYNERSLPWPEKDEVRILESRPVEGKKGVYEFKVPQAKGVLKIYALVKDSYPNLGAATTSIKMMP